MGYRITTDLPRGLGSEGNGCNQTRTDTSSSRGPNCSVDLGAGGTLAHVAGWLALNGCPNYPCYDSTLACRGQIPGGPRGSRRYASRHKPCRFRRESGRQLGSSRGGLWVLFKGLGPGSDQGLA